MIYRTLHTYILKELLRVFLLTAAALTTLLAFGGTFKPLTKQGIEVSQLMVIMLNLMPAMLAYAIPIAALFAAVLVYWRMSTDNELTACRAGGVSFMTIVMPAFLLGLTVALVDLAFVNYVVPRFLQATERAIQRDLGKLIVGQINLHEKFQAEQAPIVVTADSAELLPGNDPNMTTVHLHAMAASVLEKGRPTATVVAPDALVFIRDVPSEESVELSFQLTDATSFNPVNALQTVSASLDSQVLSSLLGGHPLELPSLLRQKPKFLNLRDLMMLSGDPYKFGDVGKAVEKIESQESYKFVAGNIQQWWLKEMQGKKYAEFEQPDKGMGSVETLRLYASGAVIDDKAPPEESLTFTGNGPGTVRIELWKASAPGQRAKVTMTYTCDAAQLVMTRDEADGTMSAFLKPTGTMTQENHTQGIKPMGVTNTPTQGIVLPTGTADLPPRVASDPKLTDAQRVDAEGALIVRARDDGDKGMRKLGGDAAWQIDRLERTISSELHSRGSFAVSCLMLVLLGAALGILLRGKNPLAVFVVGFVPAIILVLLITAGREVTEGSAAHTASGLILIWAGNGILLGIVAAVYGKLLRQ